MTPRTTPLRLTLLEDRTALSSFALGDPWPDAGNLTISFAPDTTKANGANSALFRTLKDAGPTAQWQFEILRAFQSWAAVANINLGLVDDGGDPFGTPGDVEGDYRFGDIRIGARPMSPDALANAVPFEWSAGTWSGDVLLNTAAKFGINPTSSGTYDLFTVVAHEAGHSLGLGHSNDPLSTLVENYNGAKSGLAASDVASIRSVYGARVPDAFEGPGGNGTWDTAAVLTGTGNLSASAELTTTGDVDFYRFLTPAKGAKFEVRLQTAGLSLLTAKVTVYDAAGRAVGADTSTDPTNGDLVVKVNNPTGGSFYTARVESARSDVFGVGRYRLAVAYKPATNSGPADPNDHGVNDTPAGATVLDTGHGRGGETYTGRTDKKGDVDYYRVRAPIDGSGPNLIVRVRALGDKGVVPTVQVYDENLNPVGAQVVGTGEGVVTLNVENVLRGRTYYVRVRGEAADPKEGGYRLRVAFTAPQGDDLADLSAGGLGRSAPTATGKLAVTSSGLFHFNLSATAVGGTGAATVTLVITDSRGKAVASVVQTAGAGPALLSVYLPPGEYTVTMTLTVPKGSTVAVVNYQLSGGLFSDPIGPTATATGSTPGTSGTSGTTGGATTTTTSGGFTFTPLTIRPVLSLPYSF